MHREFLEAVKRGCPLSLAQDILHRSNSDMQLKSGEFDHRKLRESRHRFAIRLNEEPDSLFTEFPRMARLLASKNQAGCQALHVPLKWAANGLIEIVDVEYKMSVRCSVCAQVAHMSVTADLHL